MRVVFAVVAILCLSKAPAGVSAGSGDQRLTAFTVGALRRDGIIIPFAVFDGRHWLSRWPAPERDRSIPINLNSIPSRWWGPPGPRDTWQAWTDREPSVIHVRQPDEVDVHCTSQIGLRTDYRPAEPPPPWSEQPYPKDGLAVSPPQPIETIAILQPAAPELRPLGPVLKAAFDKAERQTASNDHFVFRQQVRESQPPEIEAAYAYGTLPRAVYIESSRTYRALGGESCVIAFGTGWFARKGDAFTPLAMTVDLLQCDKYGATYLYPFGAMTLAGKTYWLAQFSGWDHERFVVLEIKPNEVVAVVNAWGGGC